MHSLYFSIAGHGLPCASIDTDIAAWFRLHLTPRFVEILWGLTTPGSAACVASIIGLTVLCLSWKRRWSAIATLLITVGGGSLLSESLKLVFQRQRPFESGPFGIWGGYSLPSGHTIGATLLYGFFALALLPYLSRRRWKWLSLAGAALLILGVGFSRIALGAHYLSDVLAAMALGATWLWFCSIGAKAIRRRAIPIAQSTADSPNPQPQLNSL